MSWVLALLGWSLVFWSLVAARRRTALVADAVHELRGAATVFGLAQERLAARCSTASVAELLSMPLQRMAGAIADLEAAERARRTDAGGAGEVVELGGAARAALAPWRAPMRDAGRGMALDWSPPGPLTVEADPARLAQVLGNLVGNAAEHGVGGVELRLVPLPDGARLEVRNRNAGGEPAAPAAGATGRGRGLRIAARAAQELGGRLSVSSRDGVTVARLDLPAGRGERAA